MMVDTLYDLAILFKDPHAPSRDPQSMRRAATKRMRTFDAIAAIAQSLRAQSKVKLRRPPYSTAFPIPWCAYCGDAFSVDPQDPRVRTRDHITPAHRLRIDRRLSGAENLVEVCRVCNNSKKDEIWLHWLLRHRMMRSSTR